ncbi:MAG TPA: spore cortex-lytic protein [Firmicutes bacterium]|nr:spore cortex-lytic protein [Bacillota bacterium]
MHKILKIILAVIALTLSAFLFFWQPPSYASPQRYSGNIDLLARVIAAESQGEPYEGQVAVGSVLLNRVKSSKFPNSIAGVVYQPKAFESVSNGLIWRRTPSNTAYSAARAAINGWDPTYGCTFFWNPSKRVSPWIWTRKIVRWIGNHVFAR